MARNLVRAGTPLLVWNRTPAKSEALAGEGAAAVADVAELFERAALVTGRTIVHTGTTEPAFSVAQEADVRAAGGHYVEAPVSESRRCSGRCAATPPSAVLSQVDG